MTIISSTKEIEKIIREMLISQSQLESRFVRNSLSLRGEELDKLLSGQSRVSISTEDALILFELRSRRNESDMSEDENSSIAHYRSFLIYVIIYGDNSSDLALNIVSRFRTLQVRQSLLQSGIYLETIYEPESFNEYKNETMWLRNDITIDIGCKFLVNNVFVANDIDNFDDVETINL